MPRHPREVAGGCVYHALNRAVGRSTTFETLDDYAAFEQVPRETAQRVEMRCWHFARKLMSTTKETKTLLQEVRMHLDEESHAKIEPILRGILDAAKPKTITEVVYRHDPEDTAQIEALGATIVSKDDLIRSVLQHPGQHGIHVSEARPLPARHQHRKRAARKRVSLRHRSGAPARTHGRQSA
jgi:hypothetical protein